MAIRFKDRFTSTQIVQFRATPSVDRAHTLVEVTMARLKRGEIDFATASAALRSVADYLGGEELIVPRRSITRL